MMHDLVPVFDAFVRAHNEVNAVRFAKCFGYIGAESNTCAAVT